MKKIIFYAQSTKGATAIEYAILASGISLAILSVVIIFGNDVNSLYDLLPDLTG